MKKQLSGGLFLVSGFAILTFLAFLNAWAGGEIGTGRTVSYTNPTSGYQTDYPDTWSRTEFGSAVSFSEREAAIQDPSNLSIASLPLAEIKTKENLADYLRVLEPDTSWRHIRAAGRDGFQDIRNGHGTIFLLREAGRVLSIRLKIRNDLRARDDAQTIIDGLSFDDR